MLEEEILTPALSVHITDARFDPKEGIVLAVSAPITRDELQNHFVLNGPNNEKIESDIRALKTSEITGSGQVRIQHETTSPD